MKKLLVVTLLAFLLATPAVADRINFLIGNGPLNSMSTSVAGLSTSTPDGLTTVENVTNGTTISFLPTGGSLSVVTGPVSSAPVFGANIALFVYGPGGRNSIIVEDNATSTILFEGTLETTATFLTVFPNGQGSLLSGVNVTFVDPGLLASLGTGPGFSPSGSMSATFLGDDCDPVGMTCTGQLSTAGISFQTTTAIPEPVGLGVLGMGLLTIAEGLRRWRAGKTT